MQLPFCLTTILIVSTLWCSMLHADPMAIVGGTIIDGNGGEPIRNGVIVIDGKRIVAIGKAKDVEIPNDARKINAKGKYIIPGLMDANVHLVLGFSTEYMLRFEGRFEDIIKEAAQIYLKYGVTTVFDSWGPLQPLRNVREQINQDAVIGSRVFFAGNIVGLDGPLSLDFYDTGEGVGKKALARINSQWEEGTGRELMFMSLDQIRSRIKEYIAKDIDFLKYAVNGHGENNTGFLVFTKEARRIMVEEARLAGISVQTHAMSIEGLRLAVEDNVDLMQHCAVTVDNIIPNELVEKIAKQGNSCTLNMSTNDEKLKDFLDENMQIKQKFRDKEHHQKPLLLIQHINQKKLITAGVKILLATDAGIAFSDSAFYQKFIPSLSEDYDVQNIDAFSGKGHFNWLQGAVENGLSPMNALQAATKNIAEAYKVDKNLGTLEKGKVADLIVLDKNPLISPKNYRKIHLVLKEGQIIDRKSLPLNPVLTSKNR